MCVQCTCVQRPEQSAGPELVGHMHSKATLCLLANFREDPPLLSYACAELHMLMIKIRHIMGRDRNNSKNEYIIWSINQNQEPWDQDLLPLNSIRGNPKSNWALDCSHSRGLLPILGVCPSIRCSAPLRWIAITLLLIIWEDLVSVLWIRGQEPRST